MTETFRPASLRGLELGAGAPKIIVPIVGASLDAVRTTVGGLARDDYDLVELRVDHFDDVEHHTEVLELLETVREELPDDVPVLFTFRSKPEGGARDIDARDYESLLRLAIHSGLVDAVDVEMFTELGSLERLVNGAHEAGVAVIMSSHDFERTPPVAQIVARLTLQQDLGADVVKIAVMPNTPGDVLTLLQATAEFTSTRAVRPAITMSMGPLGVVTRFAGETFGSCATFGSAGTASAPGQVDAHELRAVLQLVHAAQG